MHSWGTVRDMRSMSAMPKSISASWAIASRCKMVLVEPPMAMSSVIAFSKAFLPTERGRADSSSPS
ncbi:hypothetical protein D3C78_1858980 [compost metagenome]